MEKIFLEANFKFTPAKSLKSALSQKLISAKSLVKLNSRKSIPAKSSVKPNSRKLIPAKWPKKNSRKLIPAKISYYRSRKAYEGIWECLDIWQEDISWDFLMVVFKMRLDSVQSKSSHSNCNSRASHRNQKSRNVAMFWLIFSRQLYFNIFK